MSRNWQLQVATKGIKLSYHLQMCKVIISSAKRSYTRNDGQLSARAYSIVGRANKSSNCLSASGFQNFNLATKGTKLSAKRSYRKSAGRGMHPTCIFIEALVDKKLSPGNRAIGI